MTTPAGPGGGLAGPGGRPGQLPTLGPIGSGRTGRDPPALRHLAACHKTALPVVGEHIEEIAKRFYKHMFEARPDLLDGLFNRGNQADGPDLWLADFR